MPLPDHLSGWRRTTLLVFGGLLAAQGGASLAVRLAAGEHGDVVHPSIHLLSGAAGLALAGSPRRLLAYWRGFGAAYLLAGLVGALGLDAPWLPLGPADNVFHVLLGAAVAALAAAAPGRRQAGPARPPGDLAWLLVGWGAIALSVLVFALPADLEGPVLVPISPGHALAVLDAVALVPLLIGTTVLEVGLWRRRARLAAAIRRAPGAAAGGIFVGGLGMGLLVASGFSTFWWWWAIGAVLLKAAVVAASLLASRSEAPAAPAAGTGVPAGARQGAAA